MNASRSESGWNGKGKSSSKLPSLFLDSLINQLPHSVILTDRSATIWYVNPAFEKLSGYSSEEVVGKSPRLLKSGRHPPEFYARFWSTVSQGHVWHGHVTDKRKDGRLFNSNMTVTPILSKTGDISGYAALQWPCESSPVSVDPTSEAMLARSMNRVVSHVMHDISNAMTVILGFASLLKDDVATDPEAVQSGFMQILRAAEQAADLTRELIGFSHTHALNLRGMDINSALAGLRNLLNHVLGSNIRLELKLGEERICVSADDSLLRHLLVNLAADARDTMPEGGRLTIETSIVGEPPEESRHGTEKHDGRYCHLHIEGFTSAPSSTRCAECGTGFAVSAGIVKSFGGTIRHNPNEECTPNIEIWLPQVAASEEELLVEVEEPVPKRGTETILYVEDDEMVRASTSGILRLLGYRVIESASGGRALHLLHSYKGSLDLIISDLVMPGISGPEMVGNMPERFRATPVIYTSSYTDNFTLSKEDMVNMASFLEKPFRYEALSGVVREVLDHERTGKGSAAPS